MILFNVHLFIMFVLLLSTKWNIKHNPKIKSLNFDYEYDITNEIIRNGILLKTEKTSFQLGDKISTKNHPKAKGVNLEIRPPQHWKILEGDRPNVVIKFSEKTNTYVLTILDNITFYTRKKSLELLSKDEYTDKFIEEVARYLISYKVIEKKIVRIDSYPAFKFKIYGVMNIENNKIPVIYYCWVVYYEDKIIYINTIENTSKLIGSKDDLFNLITNSIVFPDQYK